MNGIVYDIQHVSQQYKKAKTKANDNIDFAISEGEIVGILGPNGAGKSTLIKQMVGHLKPTSGKVLYRGADVAGQTKRVAAEVAYFSQEPHVLSALKAFEALAFTGRLRGMTASRAEAEAHELLERFELQEAAGKPMKRLSGGQKRMVGIGTALIGFSPVLILDEPTNELDPKNRRLVWNMIQERNRQGSTVILVTHNVLEAERVVDRVAVVNHGRMLAMDSVAKLKQQVDQRFKFELTTEPGRREEVSGPLSRFGTIQVIGENRLVLLVDKPDAGKVLDAIVEQAEVQWPIEEYAVKPPSLEDVYFHIDEQAKKEGATG